MPTTVATCETCGRTGKVTEKVCPKCRKPLTIAASETYPLFPFPPSYAVPHAG